MNEGILDTQTPLGLGLVMFLHPMKWILFLLSSVFSHKNLLYIGSNLFLILVRRQKIDITLVKIAKLTLFMKASLLACDKSLGYMPSMRCKTFVVMSLKSLMGFLLSTRGTQIFINYVTLLDLESLLDHPLEFGVEKDT